MLPDFEKENNALMKNARAVSDEVALDVTSDENLTTQPNTKTGLREC